MQWVLVAILISGASVFISCSSDSDDNPVINPDEPQQQLADYTIIYCSRWDRYCPHGYRLQAVWYFQKTGNGTVRLNSRQGPRRSGAASMRSRQRKLTLIP